MVEEREVNSSTEPAAEPVDVVTPVEVRGIALTVLAVIAVVLTLQYAASVLIPIALGVLLSYALDPVVIALHKLRLPRAIGALVAVALLIGAIGLGVYTLSDEAVSIVKSVPTAAQRISDALKKSRRREPDSALQQVQQAASDLERVTKEASKDQTPTAGPQKVEIVQPTFRASDYLWSSGFGLLGFAGQLAVILFLVYFLLVAGDLYKRKLVKIVGPQLTTKKVTVQILDEINRQIGTFIRVQMFTSAVVALATTIVLWALDLQHYLLWGLLAGLFNSIPYLGPVLVSGGLALVAFMQFNDIARTIYVSGSAFVITSLEGFVLTPMLMGRAAEMNPVAVFVGLLFWSWIWGVWGTILAVPMLMMIKAVCDHIDELNGVGELLGE